MASTEDRSAAGLSDAPRIVSTVRDMIETAEGWRAEGMRIAFVPTMGFLHEGHLSLLREARRRGDRVVLSLFVNPTQFGPKEDLSRYPRDLEGDLHKARAVGVDVAFVPSVEEMYPAGASTFVEVRGVQEGLCGASRPGHFVGVATVVTKLFRIVRPHVALFGEKDYQQLRVLARLAVDLHLDVEVVGLPLVREPDGLAMSSRNVRLSVEERQQALVLSRALTSAARAFSEGERRVGRLLDEARAELAREPAVELQYLELRDAESLAVLDGELLGPALLAVAAWLGPRDTPERRTRLIDNVLLGR